MIFFFNLFKKLKLKYLTISFLFFFFSIGLQSACDFEQGQYTEKLMKLSSIKSLKINTLNSKKWAKNSFKIISHPSYQIPENLKKKFKGSITIFYEFGSCSFPIRLKQLGDLKDHISFLKGNLVHSLKIELEEGNLAGIINFNLFLPKTRGKLEELLGSLLIKKLGFLSPRSRLISAEFNGISTEFIFQEASSKEFLENLDRTEGPIFEGDEKFIWDTSYGEPFTLENISLSRQENKSWISKGINQKLISLKSFSILQSIYINFASQENLGISLDLKKLSQGNKSSFKNWIDYEILINSMNGYHSLRPHNRKFYWNSFTASFEPIYYDGNLEFKNIYLKNNLSGSINESIYKKWIQVFNIEDFERVKLKIKNIDLAQIQKELNLRGISISLVNLNSIINTVTRNIDELSKYKKSINERKLITKNSEIKFINNFHTIFPKGNYINARKLKNNDNIIFQSCNKKNICSSIDIDDQALEELISSRLINKEKTFFKSIEDLESSKIQIISYENNIEILASTGIKTKYDKMKGIITFRQSKKSDWVLIKDVKLENLKINFYGISQEPLSKNSQSRINENGLTGCLNFYKVNFLNSSIYAEGGGCEDLVNIVYSSGIINEARVDKVLSDGLDMDFSDIRINNLFVSNARNDCLDLSFGNYSIKDMHVVNCLDKAISVGEKSIFNGENILIENSNKGLSSKDSSKSTIKKLETKNVLIDLEAFNKKQEFGGSDIEIKEFLREELKIIENKNSNIIYPRNV